MGNLPKFSKQIIDGIFIKRERGSFAKPSFVIGEGRRFEKTFEIQPIF